MLFYDYEFSKMVIQGNRGIFFCLKVKRLPERAAKHTTHELTYHYFLSVKPQFLIFICISLSHHLLSPQHHLYFRCSSTQTLATLAHLNIIDTILTKHFQQHSAMHIFSPTNHDLLLLQNQLLSQFFSQFLSFSRTRNNFMLKRWTRHPHIQIPMNVYLNKFRLQAKQQQLCKWKSFTYDQLY